MDEHTLPDGFAMSADALFKKNIHEINGLIELGIYMKELNLSVNVIARQHSFAMENVNHVVVGQQPVDGRGDAVVALFTPPLASQPDTPVFGAADAPSKYSTASGRCMGPTASASASLRISAQAGLLQEQNNAAQIAVKHIEADQRAQEAFLWSDQMCQTP